MSVKTTVEQNVILYDIKSGLNPHIQWSANTAKTRLLLSYLGIPFETHWISYPDVTSFFKENTDLRPLRVPEEGSLPYTVPTIKDHGKYIRDSDLILEYILETYKIPRSKIIPNEDFFELFKSKIDTKLNDIFDPVVVAFTEPILENDIAKKAFNHSKSAFLGRELGQIRSDKEYVISLWKKIVEELASFEYLKKEVSQNPKLSVDKLFVGDYLYDNKFSYADIFLFGFINWIFVAIEGGALEGVPGITKETFLSPWLKNWYEKVAIYNTPN